MSPLERCGELADHRISLVLVFKSSPLKPINKTCRQAVGARSPSELVGKDLISLLVFFFSFSLFPGMMSLMHHLTRFAFMLSRREYDLDNSSTLWFVSR